MEPLTLFERRLHPQVGGARQNAFCEREDAFYVELIELAWGGGRSNERELLPQFLGVAVGPVLLVARGREVRRLTDSSDYIRPIWSPDGRFILAINHGLGSAIGRWDAE